MNGTLLKTSSNLNHFTASEDQSHLTQIGYSSNQCWSHSVCVSLVPRYTATYTGDYLVEVDGFSE